MTFLIILALVARTAAGACEASASIETLAADVPRAEVAMASLDAAGFAAAVAEARAALPCLVQPLTPLDAAGYHGLEGLAAFSEGKTDQAVLAFSAALSSLPSYRLPAMIAPPGGDLDVLLARAGQLPIAEAQPLPAYDGIVLVDGARSMVRPTGRPCILQLVAGNGKAEATYYLQGTDPLPKWDPPPTALGRILPELRRRPSIPFAVAAGSTALAAGGLYVLGGSYHARFEDPGTPYEDLTMLRTRTNASLGGALALGAASAALTTVTFLKW